MKRWYDANLIAEQEIDIRSDKWMYEELMKQKPNFDKTDGAKKVYSKKEYIVLEVKKGYIVYNINKPFDKGHSHLRSFSMAKTIIENCINKRAPKTNNLYLLSSHVRVSYDAEYIKLVEELIEAKRNKDKMKYINNRL